MDTTSHNFKLGECQIDLSPFVWDLGAYVLCGSKWSSVINPAPHCTTCPFKTAHNAGHIIRIFWGMKPNSARNAPGRTRIFIGLRDAEVCERWSNHACQSDGQISRELAMVYWYRGCTISISHFRGRLLKRKKGHEKYIYSPRWSTFFVRIIFVCKHSQLSIESSAIIAHNTCLLLQLSSIVSMSEPQKLVLVIGGTGAQGVPVVKGLFLTHHNICPYWLPSKL